MSNYYNLLLDTFRNGGYKHIFHLFNRLEKIPPDMFLNICTGYYISDPPILAKAKTSKKKPSKPLKSLKLFNNEEFPLAYYNSILGQEHEIEIRKILQLYQKWLSNYSKFKDEKLIKQLVETELANAKETALTSEKERKKIGYNNQSEDDESDSDFNFSEFDREERKRQDSEPLPKNKSRRGRRKRHFLEKEEEESDQEITQLKKGRKKWRKHPEKDEEEEDNDDEEYLPDEDEKKSIKSLEKSSEERSFGEEKLPKQHCSSFLKEEDEEEIEETKQKKQEDFMVFVEIEVDG